MNINIVLNEAKQFLVTQPFDVGHDLNHAEAVWATAQDISAQIDQKTDLDALNIACYWHDVVVKPTSELHPAGENVTDTAAHLEARLQALRFPIAFTRLTVDAVRYHQFDDKPINLEGEILWDSDKIEALNLDRWLNAKRAVDEGKMSPARLDSYINTAQEWLKILRSKYHFDYSRFLFDQRLKILTSNPELQALAREKGINLNSLSK